MSEKTNKGIHIRKRRAEEIDGQNINFVQWSVDRSETEKEREWGREGGNRGYEQAVGHKNKDCPAEIVGEGCAAWEREGELEHEDGGVEEEFGEWEESEQ